MKAKRKPRKVVGPTGTAPGRWFWLTAAQQEVVAPFMPMIHKAFDRGEPGTLVAQIETPIGGPSYIRFNFIPYHYANAVNHVLIAYTHSKTHKKRGAR